MHAPENTFALILAGGSGTRFWPLSRKDEPKQLLKFFGDKTLLRVTVDRIAPLCPPERRLCVTAAHLTEAVQAAQAARALAARKLEAEQSKFEVGMSTNYFVVQAQRDLADARNSELRAVLNYRKALFELERLQQTTLQTANIQVLSTTPGAGTATVTVR